jgi:serine/threonine protein kinase
MISFACPHCHKSIRVKDELAGKKGRCPACSQLVTVPAGGDSSAAVTDASKASAGSVRPAASSAKRTMGPKAPDANRTSVPKGTGSLSGEPTVVPDESPTVNKKSRPSVSDLVLEDPLLDIGQGAELSDLLAPSQAPDEIGRLGAYRVLEILGQGGMGIVYRAEDLQLERSVALKAMLPSLAASASARQRFLREARTAAAVEHDHIVPIFQVGEDRGVPYIAMPFLQGESLDRYLGREAPLPLAEVLRLGRQIALGLAAAQKKGLIHRDIKPANIWLEGETRRVRILDFGLARAAADTAMLTQSGAIIGTPAYMAPEQGTGGKVDGRSDLFSLGCVLYQMCTGQMAFNGNDSVSTLLAVATEEPLPPQEVKPDVPAALSDLVIQLLAKDPDDRPGSADEVVYALSAIERGKATRRSAKQAASEPAEEEPTEIMVSAKADDTIELKAEGRRPRARPKRASQVQAQVKMPAAALMVAGVLIAGVQLLAFAFGAYAVSHPAAQTNFLSRGVLLALMAACSTGAVCGIAMYIGGLKMQWLESYGWAIAAAVLAILPLSIPLLALPIGVWALVRLRPRRVKNCFGLEPPRAWFGGSSELPGWLVPTLATGGVGLILISILGIFAYRTGEKAISGDHVAKGRGSETSTDAPGEKDPRGTGTKPDGQPKESPAGGPINWNGKLALVPRKTIPGHVAAFFDDASLLTFSGPRMSRRSISDGTRIASFEGHKGFIRGLAISRDGKRIASSDESKEVILWDTASSKILKRAPTREVIRALAFSADGKRLAGGGSPRVWLWDADTLDEISNYTGNRSGEFLERVAFTPDGTQVVSGGQTFRVWDTQTGATTNQTGPLGGRMRFAISKDASYYVLATSHQALYRRPATGLQKLKDLRTNLWDVANMPGNLCLFVSGDRFVGLADPDTGDLVARLDMPGRDGLHGAVSPSGRFLAVSENDRDETHVIEIKQAS